LRSNPIKTAGLCGILLLTFAPACSRRSSQQPITVTFLDLEWDVPRFIPGLGRDLEDFTRETGIQVQRLPSPDGSLNQLAVWRSMLQRGAAAPDLYTIDVIWPPMLNQYFMDLKPYFAADLSSQYPGVVASYTVGGKLIAMPHHAYVSVLLYRPDLLREYGYHEPPQTWDELETMAARIQAGERSKGAKDFWGYVWPASPSEDLTCMGMEWQISGGGGGILEDNGTVSVNNPQAIRAWQRAARWIGTISPPGVTAYGKWDARNIWASGKAVFLVDWMSNYNFIHWTAPGAVDQVGVTAVPGGPTVRASTLGGNGLAISRNSTHAREALRLIRFLLKKDAAMMRASEHSEPHRGVELFELPSILKPYPDLPGLKQPGGGIVARPSLIAGEKYEAVSRAYIGAVYSVLTREKPAAAAVAELEKKLVDITGFRRGPPAEKDWWFR
jgi:trehalose/maltose transport system substrate-binding protein